MARSGERRDESTHFSQEADEEDDLCPDAFPNDEHRVVARPSTEFADDSLIDESSLLPAPSNCPGAFPNDEHRVVARPPTEFADDSLIDESSLSLCYPDR
ncbi:uncharacterized protein CPUR_01442 [Claviceps purpurea 20.1]|uniref:Uncharacterized protein n=1 Tax=Claviceps purpurea (strain 20.1) TaxID=1111077 RepID=M1W6P0_CLAP2|nr:uncharacterized protein CPUR_01442 [Claviceps purpurea 20.1]